MVWRSAYETSAKGRKKVRCTERNKRNLIPRSYARPQQQIQKVFVEYYRTLIGQNMQVDNGFDDTFLSLMFVLDDTEKERL